MHHWAADVFVGSIAVHMCRVFFTGAFRKPRELNWIVGVTLLTLAIVNGFIGYSLPDDLISGTGPAHRVLDHLVHTARRHVPVLVPVRREFPGRRLDTSETVHHARTRHTSHHLRAARRAPRTPRVPEAHPVRRARPHGEERRRLSHVPNFILKTTGFMFMVTGVLWALGGLVQINPIWQFGPYQPSKISYAVQPDWYMGWLDGALRIMPSWEFAGFGHTIPFEVFLPAVLFPGLSFGLFYAWPFVEAWLTRDHAQHQLLDRPRDRPKRTGIGAGFLAFYFCLFAASSTDVLANFFHISLNIVLWSFRFIVIIVPIIAGFVTWRICLDMAGVPGIGKRKRAVVVVRSAEGQYVTIPTPPRPGDGHEEEEPITVPVAIDVSDDGGLEPVPAGVRRVDRR